jgi:hypothetical protein
MAAHKNRGVRRNRRIQRIDVASEIFHDGAAQQVNVRATSELDGACRIGGLGLRSHAYRGANQRCNRNYLADCHVVPVVGIRERV